MHDHAGWMPRIAAWGIALASLASGAGAQPGPPGLPPVPEPAENPITEAKRALGKILFWDEQLSSDNTTACATCHIPATAGTDPRVGLNPGLDALAGTPDDVLGSPGLVDTDAAADYVPSPVYDLNVQVTPRQAPPSIVAMYAPELFWDGRAGTVFLDPENGSTVITLGGALENQAIGPPLSDVEMAHEARDWPQINAKLASARPLALASDIPPDMAAAIQSFPAYPDLFTEAFGDATITASRIAMAIATYERTLLPDQTPWDLFAAGNPGALTPQQLNGFNAFVASPCAACHTPPFFTNHTFRNIGLRPIAEDSGREAITGNPADAGRFKVPSLRNIALRDRFMHNGRLANLGQVFDFYAIRAGQQRFPQNQDPLVAVPIVFPPPVQADITNFLVNGLTDPRVAAEQFPFDRPTLHSERTPANPLLLAGGVPGSGGLTPTMIAISPPLIGDADFKIGVGNALGGATARVAISSAPPVAGVVAPDELAGPITLAGGGFGTLHWPIPDDGNYDGRIFYMQWRINDPSAAGGVALSRPVELTVFCGTGTCEPSCVADVTTQGAGPSEPGFGVSDGLVTAADLNYYVNAWVAGDTAIADLTTTGAASGDPGFGVPDAAVTTADLQYYVNLWVTGCP